MGKDGDNEASKTRNNHTLGVKHTFLKKAIKSHKSASKSNFLILNFSCGLSNSLGWLNKGSILGISGHFKNKIMSGLYP